MLSRIPSALLLTGAVLALSSIQARASVVMDFTGLQDFSNFSQNGIDMASNSVWNWPGTNEAHMDGGVATFSLGSLGDFTLESVSMNSNGGSGPARFTAFNNGIDLGFVDVGANAGTFVFPALFSAIDQFRVSVPSSHFTFDNVTIGSATSVPDGGATVALLGMAMGGMVWVRRKLA